MWAASDEALLAGLATGDADAIAAFVRRFQRRVFGLALAIVGDQGVAEDVAQEAFARAWRHAQAYDARRGPVAAWLLAITRNLAIDAIRLRRAEPTDPEEIIALGIAESEAGPDERAIAGEDIARLRRAIAGLPLDQRRALVLAAFYGRTAREISDSEQVPLGTAKTRIRAAMMKLRSALEVSSDRSDAR
jgi:RNA polymerase sigma-70 factor (ECF subfamily)